MRRATAMRGRFALLAAGAGLLWLGGVPAVAAAAPSAPSVVEFSVPDTAAIDQLNRLGYDLAEYRRPNADGTITIAAVVTPEERARFEAMGYKAGAVVETPQSQAAARAEADADAAKHAAALANLHSGKAKRAAAADTVLTSRADYFENYAGRYLSIEARTSDGSNSTSANPVMTAAWDAGAGTPLGGTGQEGVLSPYIDRDPPDADYYLYHRNIFRVGDLGDGKPTPTQVRVASSNGGSDTIPVKRWTSHDGKGFPAGYLQDFNTGYVDPQQAYAKIRSLAAEFPNLAQIYDLPNKTNGYQRKAQAIVGLKTPYAGESSIRSINGSPDETSAIRQSQAVVLTTLAWGQDGGNDVTVQLEDPGAGHSPLSVVASGKAITVSLATNDAGAVTSTAAQVVDAINASGASALVKASLYRTNSGDGVVVPATQPTKLSDYLNAPPEYPRGPQTVQMIRLGAHRDGTKTGVFLYCQEHAREWATSLVCLETAERLLRNYATDARTKELLDNLDVFIIPVINADGVAYSRYDFTSQRKNMFNYCTAENGNNTDPTRRNSWGVDINRNFSVGSFFDGYVGASSSCTSEVFAGTGEFSEPESRNEQWVQSTFPNIKFANNVHSYGGYFMWPPGAYKTVGRETLPYASFGVNQFFDETAATVLERIQNYRQTTVLPSRTGPVADVLYSAAGNSADEAYYSHGIIGYDFEIGVDRITGTNSDGTPRFSAVGFTPPYDNEGHDEGMEFANGNVGMLEAALDYERDTTPPVVTPKIASAAGGGLEMTFEQSEPADIYYTTDGSTPTTASPRYAPEGPRQRVQAVHLPGPVTLKWMAVDIKGQSDGVHTYVWSSPGTPGTVGGTVPATLSLSVGAPASFGTFIPGVARTYTASTAATVTSTAGDALLSVADPSDTATGHLVNGAFSLPQPLQARARDAHNTGTAFNNVGSLLNLLVWDGPVSNDQLTLEFSQRIDSGDALRTGNYGKTLTFTLSTTTP